MRSRDRRSGVAWFYVALALAAFPVCPAVADDLGPGPTASPAADGSLDTYPSTGANETLPAEPRHRQPRKPRVKHIARPKAPKAGPMVILPVGSNEPTGSGPAGQTGAGPTDASGSAAPDTAGALAPEGPGPNPADATGLIIKDTQPKEAAKAKDRRLPVKAAPVKTATPKHAATAPVAVVPASPPLPPRIPRPTVVKAALPVPAPAPVPMPMPVEAALPLPRTIASIPASNPVRERAEPKPEQSPPAPMAPMARPDSDEALTQLTPAALQQGATVQETAHEPTQGPALAIGGVPPDGPAAPWASADRTLVNDSRRQLLGDLQKEQSRYADQALRQLREERQEGF